MTRLSRLLELTRLNKLTRRELIIAGSAAGGPAGRRRHRGRRLARRPRPHRCPRRGRRSRRYRRNRASRTITDEPDRPGPAPLADRRTPTGRPGRDEETARTASASRPTHRCSPTHRRPARDRCRTRRRSPARTRPSRCTDSQEPRRGAVEGRAPGTSIALGGRHVPRQVRRRRPRAPRHSRSGCAAARARYWTATDIKGGYVLHLNKAQVLAAGRVHRHATGRRV